MRTSSNFFKNIRDGLGSERQFFSTNLKAVTNHKRKIVFHGKAIPDIFETRPGATNIRRVGGWGWGLCGVAGVAAHTLRDV